MQRLMLQDYTFSDGTTVPAGSTVSVRVGGAHHNAELYPDPLRFDGFRFVKMREEAISNGSTGKTFDIVSVNANYLPFGYGRHACPGRFFAAYELKQMLAHVVLNYDVKFENEGVRPPNKRFMTISLPDPTVEVLFRKRKTE
jgi:cytochrome P450